MLLGGAWSFHRSKKPWWSSLGLLLLGLLCLGISIWRIQTGWASPPGANAPADHPRPHPVTGRAPHHRFQEASHDRSRARAAARRRRAGRTGRPPRPGRGGHRDRLRRAVGGRARVPGRRRELAAPGGPRRGLRPGQQCLDAGRGGRRRRDGRRALRRDPRRRIRRRGPGHRVATRQPRHRRARHPEWTAEVLAEHGDRIAVGLDVRGTTLAARGWTREGGDLWETLERLDEAGCQRYVVTDVTKDGTLRGPNLDLLREVCARTEAK